MSKPLENLPDLPNNSFYPEYKSFICTKSFKTSTYKSYLFETGKIYFFFMIECGYNPYAEDYNRWCSIFDENGIKVAFELDDIFIGRTQKYDYNIIKEVDSLFDRIFNEQVDVRQK